MTNILVNKCTDKILSRVPTVRTKYSLSTDYTMNIEHHKQFNTNIFVWLITFMFEIFDKYNRPSQNLLFSIDRAQVNDRHGRLRS